MREGVGSRLVILLYDCNNGPCSLPGPDGEHRVLLGPKTAVQGLELCFALQIYEL